MTLHITEPLPDYCVPKELLLHVPQPEHIKQYFPNGDYERKIFTNIALDPHEKDAIAKLRALQKLSGLVLKRSMESRVLRYLSHARGDEVKALDALVRTQEWRRTFFSPRLSDAVLKDKLNRGLLYFCGRDGALRPFLVVRAKVAFDKAHNWKQTDIANLFAFCIEFALRYLLIPGKVETMNVVLDLARVSIVNLRSDNLRGIMQILSKHYVGRLYQMLVINPPSMLSVVWGLAKSFLSDRQVAKTAFVKKSDIATGRCAKHQLEVQYGGSIPTLTKFYPFTFPSGPFDVGHTAGRAEEALAHGYRCLNARTVCGALADTDIVPPTQWSSKGHDILSQLDISFTITRPTRRMSRMTDFPDDEDLPHADNLSFADLDDLVQGEKEEGEEEAKGQDEVVPSQPEQEPTPDTPATARLPPSDLKLPLGDVAPLDDDTGSTERLSNSGDEEDDDAQTDSERDSSMSSNPMSMQESLKRLHSLAPSRSTFFRQASMNPIPKSNTARMMGNKRSCMWCCAMYGGKFEMSPNPGNAVTSSQI
eukprot:GEMP01007860.1.p1 GENE.GEMP01007860.1~~GEMP01007860.1.p1  ORF type:complete len:535 (+),score=104.36 GEMP01007860.1:211-1815(+)